MRKLIDQGDPLENFSIDTVGLTYGTPDENVKAALNTAREYGRINKRSAKKSSGRSSIRKRIETGPMETTIRSEKRTVVIGLERPLVIIGERINPTGRKDLADALERGDLRAVQKEAVAQAEAGAHILDVNVGVSGIDEPRILQEAVAAIQEVTDLPLCIDSALPKALEAALKVYKGKALVNSVNGEKDKLERILPLIKEYGAAVIGLTMNDRGIPKKAEERLRIADTILEEAMKMGIPAEDVIIDPLAMAMISKHRRPHRDHQSSWLLPRMVSAIRRVPRPFSGFSHAISWSDRSPRPRNSFSCGEVLLFPVCPFLI